MTADPIVYCLERLTDYRQFERFAADLMDRTDYPGIEPLGGTGDAGRDALYVHRDGGATTVFAFSVRSDWTRKFRDDCDRISEAGHKVDTIVFVSTQEIRAAQKDQLRAEIGQLHGWTTEYYDVERIRVLLAGRLASLIAHHPSIFVPPWFEQLGGEVVTRRQRDLIVIDHLKEDHAFAVWLFGRLSAAGYSVWCSGVAPLVGEDADSSIRTLIRQRAIVYLPVLSKASERAPDLRSRMAVATEQAAHVMPCWLSGLDAQTFESRVAALLPARFEDGWAGGLSSIVRKLEVLGVSKPLVGEVGSSIALRAYGVQPLLRQEPEWLYSNVFPVSVPTTIRAYELDPDSAPLDEQLEHLWPHVRYGEVVFSFMDVPKGVRLGHREPRLLAWRASADCLGIPSDDLVKVLVRRTLLMACRDAGYQWCASHKTLYLDEAERQRHAYQHVDGRYTHVSLTGVRSIRSGERKVAFRFQLGPRFRVTVDRERSVWVIVSLYVRLTDDLGEPLDKRLIPARRKRVTKNWWNREWLRRTLCTMQVISGGAEGVDGRIRVGAGKQAVSIATKPLAWECPVSIDFHALEHSGDFQEELASAREVQDEEDAYQEIGEGDG